MDDTHKEGDGLATTSRPFSLILELDVQRRTDDQSPGDGFANYGIVKLEDHKGLVP